MSGHKIKPGSRPSTTSIGDYTESGDLAGPAAMIALAQDLAHSIRSTKFDQPLKLTSASTSLRTDAPRVDTLDPKVDSSESRSTWNRSSPV